MSLRKLLYTPSGRAGNYANGGFAANLFKGCDKLCRYCFVPDFLKMNSEQKKDFRTKVIPAPDVLERLEKDLTREQFKVMSEPIFMCFSCDAYPYDEFMQDYTRKSIEMILSSGNSVNILTKAGTVAIKDFDLLVTDSRNKIGATLTFADEKLSRYWEPNAALPLDRIDMLKIAHDAGIYTWASIEPVLNPEESLRIMTIAMEYVDEFKIGKLNHMSNTTDWKQFALDAMALMEKHNKRYVLKDDLKKFL